MKTQQYSSVNIRPLLVFIGWARVPVFSAPYIPADPRASTLSSFSRQQHPDYASQIPPNWQESCTRGLAWPSLFKHWAQGLKCGQSDSLSWDWAQEARTKSSGHWFILKKPYSWVPAAKTFGNVLVPGRSWIWLLSIFWMCEPPYSSHTFFLLLKLANVSFCCLQPKITLTNTSLSFRQ